jgi:radical SAM superfamily enzyme YgiQ (UPF0313 family)
MKVCLVNVNHANLMREYAYQPSIGLLMIAAVLEQNNYQVEILDLPWLSWQGKLRPGEQFSRKVARQINEQGPDILGFGTLCDTYPMVLNIARRCKTLNPSLKIILGGPQATLTDLETLKNFLFIDLIVRGEGELTIVDLLDTIKKGGDLGQVAGITYRDDGRIVRTAPRALIADLDTLPLPAYHLIEEVFHQPKPIQWRISVGRGCPYQCAYCAASVFWQRLYRLRNPQNIIKEIRLLKERYGIRNFELEHDHLLAHPAKFRELCQTLIQAKLGIRWGCESRIDCITPELLDLMAQAGCQEIGLGLESGSPRIQRIMHKNLDVSVIPKIIRECRRRNIRVITSYIVGFPEETKEDINATMRLALRCAPVDDNSQDLRGHVLRLMPGTIFFERYQHRLHWTNLISRGDVLEGVLRIKENQGLIRQYPPIFSFYYAIKLARLPQTLPYEVGNIFFRIIQFYPKSYACTLTELRIKPLELLEMFKEWVCTRIGIQPRDFASLSVASIRRYFPPFLKGLYRQRDIPSKSLLKILKPEKTLVDLQAQAGRIALARQQGEKVRKVNNLVDKFFLEARRSINYLKSK